MNTTNNLRKIWWGLFLYLPLVATAQETEDVEESDDLDRSVIQAIDEPKPDSEGLETGVDAQTTVTALPIYIPPSRGAAKSRVGAATRGARTDLGLLTAFAPDHVGHTTHPQPELYWFIDSVSNIRIDISMIDDRSAEPLLEATLAPPVAAGFHKIDLSNYDVTLQPRVVYQWFVAYVPNPGRRSNDVIASGAVQLVQEKSELDSTDPIALAKSGIWYDAVMVLRNRLASNSNDANAAATLQALAREVDLQVSRAH